ncbi:MAG TPA: T9SS type A sorting domain-containing protein [Bacteroidia bacterium]|nr:T9SS type A sorting domain-containing protein [Bacteroidia bacterium]
MKKSYLLIFGFFCFEIATSNAQFTVLHNFNDTNGGHPYGSLILSGRTLFGMAVYGGKYNRGCIFSIDTNGAEYKTLLDFNDTNGTGADGSLITSGKVLYGMTGHGGVNGMGCIFSIDTNGSRYKDLYDFNGLYGGYPQGSLVLSGGILYGLASGYPTNDGCVFSIDTNGSGYKDILNFNGTNGANPFGSLVLSGNVLYGMTAFGGTSASSCSCSGYGLIFSVKTDGSKYKNLLNFNGVNGEEPWGSLTLLKGVLYGMTYYGGIHSMGNIFSIDTNGYRYKDLLDFNDTNGSQPIGSLIISGGVLLGMSGNGGGGKNGKGNIFSIDTNGSEYTDLFDFNGINGEFPKDNLTLSGNVLYGMTPDGGTDTAGVIFRFKDATMGINQVSASPDCISIFPNPSNGSFNLRETNAHQLMVNSSVEIYNMLGEKIYTAKINATNTQIDLSNNPSGIYLYRVITETGGLVSEGKLVIQK